MARKIFSGAKVGRVEIKANRQETKRMLRAEKTCGGRGRTGTGFERPLARYER